ncbi:transposase [Patescibacteria group bacterium]|nr:transposase [Patescibacteria group bacterium]
MPNKPRDIYPNNYYHIYNRAVEKRTIFYTEKDYEYFIEKVAFYRDKTGIKILAYCVLPNHFHFLLKEPKSTSEVKITAIARFISLLSNSYTKYFNLNKEHSGRVFQGPYKSKLVDDDDYLNVLLSYINLNPLKHKMVTRIQDWYYTSHHNYIGQAKNNLIYHDYLVDFKEYKKITNSYKKAFSKIDDEFNLEG